MNQRVFFFVVEQTSSLALDWPRAFCGTGRSGVLAAPESASSQLIDSKFFQALNDAKLESFWIGEEWRPLIPAKFNGLALVERGKGWRVQPEMRGMHVLTGLPANSSGPTSRVDAAGFLTTALPWKCCALWLKVGADPESVRDRLRTLLRELPANVVSLGIFLTPQQSHWFCRSSTQGSSALSECSAPQLLSTALKTLGVPNRPAHLPLPLSIQ